MADIALDSVTNGGGLTSWSHTVTGVNPTLWVGITGNTSNTDGVSGVTFNSVAMSLVGKIQTPSNRYVYLFGLINPATGAHTVALSGADLTNASGASASYINCNQALQPEASATNSATASSSLATSVTTVTNRAWTILYAHGNVSASPGAGAGLTSRDADTTLGALFGDSNGAITPAGSTSLTITGAADNFGVVMAAIRALNNPSMLLVF